MNSDILSKFTTLITVFFGFIAAFAWNDLIQLGFSSLFPNPDPIIEMIGYAVIMTILALVVAVIMGMLAKSASRRDL